MKWINLNIKFIFMILDVASKKHIFISYDWSNQKMAEMINENLKVSNRYVGCQLIIGW